MLAKKHKKKKGPLLFIALIFLVLISTICVYGSIFFGRLKGSSAAAKEIDIKNPVNILVMGLDAGDYDNKSKDKPKRSDTMMLLRYIPETQKVYILSLPRDTRVNINGHIEKLNAAHLTGGADTTIKTIEDMLDISINYYAEVDYEGFRECIDAIGGIDVVVLQDMNYDAYDIKIHFNKGETVHLDGKKAEEFVRWRKNNDGSGYAMGDLGRIDTQQEFMMKILEKVKSPSSIIKLPNLVNILSKYAKTNMSPSIILKYGLKIKSIESSVIEKKVLEGEPQYIGGISYFVWNKNKSSDYLSNFRDKELIAKIDKSNVNILVFNATGVKGLAKNYSDELSKEGYIVIGTENYFKRLDNTIINDFSNNNYGNAVYDDLKIGEVIEKSSDDKSSIKQSANVVVILGLDSVK